MDDEDDDMAALAQEEQQEREQYEAMLSADAGYFDWLNKLETKSGITNYQSY